MLRRLTLLAALLLTLSVFAPAVLACGSADGCCPEQETPCGPEVAEVVACCGEQPMQALVSVAVRELEALDPQLPHGAAALAVGLPGRLHSIDPSPVCLVQRLSDQRQLYLHTGRLRL